MRRIFLKCNISQQTLNPLFCNPHYFNPNETIYLKKEEKMHRLNHKNITLYHSGIADFNSPGTRGLASGF
jgi:hypothetical protein